MSAAVCTLFEGDYHIGVAALANSLYCNGFRGSVIAGYRGGLPSWAGARKGSSMFHELAVAEGLSIQFVPVSRPGHLTNVKPHFMLDVWDRYCAQAQALCYFDPDIVVKCRWSFFEEWIRAGIALCADINGEMSANHPIRYAWSRFFEPKGFTARRELNVYLNGGFVGVHRAHRGFLTLWMELTELMAPAIGGLDKTNVADRSFMFCKTDQDVLNFSAMVSPEPISVVGRDGMDFQEGGGGYIMSHAAGAEKPWRKQMLASAVLRGIGPSRADYAFLKYLNGPIMPWGRGRVALRKLDRLCAAAFARYFTQR